MFNLGFSEMIFLAVIALIVIGPKQLPQVARVVARLINDLKRATTEVTKPFSDLKNEAQEMAQSARNSVLDLGSKIENATNLEIHPHDPTEEEIQETMAADTSDPSQKPLAISSTEVGSIEKTKADPSGD